jgi:hypothetical protein
MMKWTLVVFLGICAAAEPSMWGQKPAATATAAITKPLASAPVIDNPPGLMVMIENRARVLLDKVDGSGTRYFSVKDSDLAGKTPEEVAKRLSPTPVIQGNVKKVDVAVDLERPRILYTDGKVPLAIGTTTIEGNVKDVDIRTSIILNDVTIKKRQ